MLQEHDAALLEAGKDGIVMSYTGGQRRGRSFGSSNQS